MAWKEVGLLIDSEAGLNLIDRTLVKDWSLPRRKLKKPLAIG